jgi:hypothetical protein
MQLMGECAREHGYTGYLPELCEPATGLEWGCVHLAAKLASAGGDISKGLEMWNGGANPTYASEVLARLKNYQ